MSSAEMDQWLKDNPNIKRNALSSTNNLQEAARVIAVLMEKERSFVTGNKIRQVLVADPNVEIWVNCGALHVANILRGIYNPDAVETGVSSSPATFVEPVGLHEESMRTLAVPRNDPALLFNPDPLATIKSRVEESASFRDLEGVFRQLQKTSIVANSTLIHRAMEIIDNGKDLSDKEKVSLYLFMYQNYVHVQSPDMRPLVNSIMKSINSLNLTADQKLQGLHRILSGTNFYQTELLEDIMDTIQSLVDSVQDKNSLILLQKTLRNLPSNLSSQLRQEVERLLKNNRDKKALN